MSLGLLLRDVRGLSPDIIVSFQQFPTAIVFKYLHLLDGNLVELHKTFALGHTVVDEYGVDVLHVRQADEFVDGGVVADVAF